MVQICSCRSILTCLQDFRSDNGLYSLIQAQFDAAAAAKSIKPEPPTSSSFLEEDTAQDGFEVPEDSQQRRSKRRKISREPTPDVDNSELSMTSDLSTATEVKDEIQVQFPPTMAQTTQDKMPVEESIIVCQAPTKQKVWTPRRTRQESRLAYQSSPLSSPPAEIYLPSSFRRVSRLQQVAQPLSSPLSSPPPVLFDPFSEDCSDQRSTSPSEIEEDSPCKQFSSSQTSNSMPVNLPNMKGKDLFDVSIWSDPLRTSVFYTFATSLRQKIKDVQPTVSHRFISHLRDRGKLVRCYTQNIDQIEEKVGLSTTLTDGPGSRGRFSRRSTANAAVLNKMVEETPEDREKATPPHSQLSNADESQLSQPSQETPTSSADDGGNETANDQPKPVTKKDKEPPKSGVECVFLHGSLDQLRCFVCHKVCAWDDQDREAATLSGQQPQCPHCLGATVAREERGKRSLGVGKLRPDIVLYGEEHPNAHLISPIVTHDLALSPDLLLILGTSLRVHGLKVMVREFAKAVHNRGGKVVFVNFTKPPESSWGDIIDYWVQWDCDAWVGDLQDRIPRLWNGEPEPPKLKKRLSDVKTEDPIPEGKGCPAKNPAAIRDTKHAGAYWTMRIVDDLHKITGTPLQRRASIVEPIAVPKSKPNAKVKEGDETKVVKRRPRKSAPGGLGGNKPSTLNPNHGRSRKSYGDVSQEMDEMITDNDERSFAISAIINSVKINPRIRKRKTIDGEVVVLPTVGKGKPKALVVDKSLTLPPLLSVLTDSASAFPYGKPLALEPQSPPSGPLSSISPNLRSAKAFGRNNAFFIQDTVKGLEQPKAWEMNGVDGRENMTVEAFSHGLRPARPGRRPSESYINDENADVGEEIVVSPTQVRNQQQDSGGVGSWIGQAWRRSIKAWS